MSSEAVKVVVKVLEPIQHNGTNYAPPVIIEMTKPHADQAIEMGVVEMFTGEIPLEVLTKSEGLKVCVEELLMLEACTEEQAIALVEAGFENIDAIQDATIEELVAVKTVGKATATKLKEIAEEFEAVED